MTLAQLTAALDRLSAADLLQLHREVCRRASPIYRALYRDSWASGVAKSRERQRAGYAAHRERVHG